MTTEIQPNLEPTLGRMRERDHYIDRLRSVMIALVILHHTAITYGASGGWFYHELNPPSTLSSVILTLFCATNQAYLDPGHPADRADPHHPARRRRAGQPGRQPLQLPGPAGERRDIPRQRPAGRRRRPRPRPRLSRRGRQRLPGRGARPRGRGDELLAGRPVQPERPGQQDGGVLAGGGVDPALQVTDRPLAHRRGLGQLVLGQPGPVPQPPQQPAETQSSLLRRRPRLRPQALAPPPAQRQTPTRIRPAQAQP